MKIEAVDLFYLSMPVVTTEADGSQDALLVRVRCGWPRGLGRVRGLAADLHRELRRRRCRTASAGLSRIRCSAVRSTGPRRHCADQRRGRLQQHGPAAGGRTPFPASRWRCGIFSDKARGEPVWRSLGYAQREPKTPYASLLFGDTPQETLAHAAPCDRGAFAPSKLGWGPFGRGKLADGCRSTRRSARRPGSGRDPARRCRPDLERGRRARPLLACRHLQEAKRHVARGAVPCLGPRGLWPQLAGDQGSVKLAGGEGAHNVSMARHLIDYGKVGFIQIDCGRIGGIGPAAAVAKYAEERGRDLCQSHLHIASRAERFDPALCGPCRPPHLRIPGGAQAAGHRHHRGSSRHRCPGRSEPAGQAGAWPQRQYVRPRAVPCRL